MNWDRDDIMERIASGDPAVSDAVVLRAIADREADAVDAAGGERSAENGSIAFERQLRQSVARVMGDVSTPDGLEARVRAAIAADQATGAAEAASDGVSDGASDRVRHAATETRSRSFWARHHRSRGLRAGGLALAAVCTLAAVGLFFNAVLGPAAPGTDGYRTALAQFVVAEHSRVAANDAVASKKWVAIRPDEAKVHLANHLEASAELPAMCDRVKFVGCGDCGVPGASASNHMQFLVRGPSGETYPVSLFVAKTGNRLDLDPGVTYAVNTDECGVPGASVYVWVRDGLMYSLVSGSASADSPSSQPAAGCRMVLEAFGHTGPLESL